VLAYGLSVGLGPRSGRTVDRGQVHNNEEQELIMRSDEAQVSESATLRHVVDSLYAEFGHRQTREALHRAVEHETERWSTAPVKDFVPIFVERSVRSRLRA
jgi:hypothetical protein